MSVDWDHPGFTLPPLAEATGPFTTSAFLQVADRHEQGEALLVSGEGSFMALRAVDGEIRFAGDGEVTDYHTPLGDRPGELVAELAVSRDSRAFALDSLPEEAAVPLAAGLEESGRKVSRERHEVTAVLPLPRTFDEWLTSIGKKERHEVRRKRRRYEAAVGEVHHETHHGPGWAFDEFVRLHRLASGEKGAFLTDDMERLFGALAALDGWRLDVLRVDDSASAVVFGWSDDTGYYLYNSAYDPTLGEASPGVVLLGAMIQTAIAEGLPRFDFLKGDEAYKFRLGAAERPLFRVSAGEAP